MTRISRHLRPFATGPSHSGAGTTHGLNRIEAIGIGAGSIVLWLVVLSMLVKNPVLDERNHFAVIQQFTEGDWHLPQALPMAPTYHAAAAVVSTGPSRRRRSSTVCSPRRCGSGSRIRDRPS